MYSCELNSWLNFALNYAVVLNGNLLKLRKLRTTLDAKEIVFSHRVMTWIIEKIFVRCLSN